ncbi:hypothetical protein [Roseovarius sp. M141]|uniref:hypothetical protein n=1 Tax=Roseovarius sp. M141 TaxID=2583806 RepID=UPI0020CC0320|nr:hypothetical protein [Roseovarius sp. M141]MCQ0091210.1 hypothetical protein [Roseovarius sp. M141]
MSGSLDKPTPKDVDNRPGLPQIAARAGTHQTFYESMRRGLADANRPGLSDLRARGQGDVTLGVLDAWAAVLDTLTFYGERTANEAYLRTATDRASLRAHASLIGYQLAPAKAASVHLAFIAEANDAPEDVLEYDVGLQVRSVPRDGEIPQIYETIEPLTAYAGWNAMTPRMSYPQELDGESDTVRLAAGSAAVTPGDPVLFLQGKVPVKYEDASKAGFLRSVNGVAELAAGEKLMTLSAAPTGTFPYFFFAYTPVMAWAPSAPLTTLSLISTVSQASWSVSALSTATAINHVSYFTLATAITAVPYLSFDPILPAKMRVKAGCFGNNAITQPSPLIDDIVAAFPPATPVASPGAITDTQGHTGDTAPPANHVYIYLDREYPEIVAGEYVLVRDAFSEGHSVVHGVELLSVEAYGLSTKVTRLEVNASLTGPSGTVQASGFLTRKTTVYAAPQALPLAALPITHDVGAAHGALGADSVELGSAQLSLFPGKTVALTGERADLAGVVASEILTVSDNVLNDGLSVLTFTAQPAHAYLRDTVTLNANVAEATHGETVAEIIGDGDAARSFATYPLKSKPLTHVSAKSETGMAPALEVRVNGVLWTLVEDFRDAGPEDRVYILRIAEDDTASIVFGDGEKGLRPPTGQDNVEAAYRKGAGSDGMLEAGQLSLLATKPAGLKSVVNPLAPAAAADAEGIDDARRNAPLKVLTLGRVVSLRDYEDYARAFAGIAKARADWTFDGFRRPIFVTVAGEGGVLLPDGGEDMTNLLAALQGAGEADITISVRNYQAASFVVVGRLFIDAAFEADDVIAAARQALEAGFSFEARDLGQGVSRAQVIAVLQLVVGVTGVDVDHFHRSGAAPTLEHRLGSARPQPSLDGAIPAPAEMLTIDMAATKLEAVT